MPEDFLWKEARKFLRGKYGVRNIVSMSAPLPGEGAYGTWYARIAEGDTTFGVEFIRKSPGNWKIKELRSS